MPTFHLFHDFIEKKITFSLSQVHESLYLLSMCFLRFQFVSVTFSEVSCLQRISQFANVKFVIQSIKHLWRNYIFSKHAVSRPYQFHQLSSNSKLKMLGNLEIKRKSQNQVRTQANAQPPFQKLIFSNGAQKLRKSIQVLWLCPIFLDDLTFFQLFYHRLQQLFKMF